MSSPAPKPTSGSPRVIRVAGVALARTFDTDRWYLIPCGLLYLLLFLYGLVIAHDSAMNFVPLNNADWLHLGLAVVMVALGTLLGRSSRRGLSSETVQRRQVLGDGRRQYPARALDRVDRRRNGIRIARPSTREPALWRRRHRRSLRLGSSGSRAAAVEGLQIENWKASYARYI
ncbi:MAG TPA: DUF4383 domain-containing protein [Mycobacterium sp.]|nr:DUF4383 domain-containing protein [Mycobacterium sp.]